MMKYYISKRTLFGSLLIALAFSDSIRIMTSWFYPFIMLSLLVVFYCLSMISGHGLKRAEYIFKKYLVVGVIPYLMIFLYSLFLVYYNHQDSKFIRRSLGSTLIAIMTLCISASLVYIFGEKSPDVLCYGLLLNYVIHIILNCGEIGLFGFFRHIGDPLNTYQDVFEMHSVGFTLNLLLIYYIVKTGKKDKRKIIVILIISYLIMKRIAFVGLLLAAVSWFCTDIILRKRGNKKYIIIMWGLAISSLIYVGIISIFPESFKELMLQLGILNRYLMTNSFSDYYSFSVKFLGRGFGFVSVLMPNMDIVGARVSALHNDILKDYIEEGFIGFCLLYFYIFVGAPRAVIVDRNKKNYVCITMMLIYTFVTLMTDNVLEYVSYTCTWFTIYGVVHLYGGEILMGDNTN